MLGLCDRQAIHFRFGLRSPARRFRPTSGPARCCRRAGARARLPAARFPARSARRPRTGLLELRFQAAHRRLRSPRCRSSRPASSARSAECSSASAGAFGSPASPVPAARLRATLPSRRAGPRALRKRFWLFSRCSERFLPIHAQPLQFQPRHREPRIRAVGILGHLAHLVLQRQRDPFRAPAARCAAAPAPLRAGRSRGSAPRTAPPRPRAASASRRSVMPTSRASRFRASGPLAVFLPPVSVWP